MGVFSGPEIVTSGLIHVLEPTNFNGNTSLYTYTDSLGSTWAIYNYSNAGSLSTTTLLSNVNATSGAGNSYIVVSPKASLNTGSISVVMWFNLKGATIDTSTGNEWRGLWSTATSGTSGNPFTMVLEQSGTVNFTVTNDDATGYRRFLANNFGPYTYTTNGWQMLTFTYNKSTGTAAAYKNGVLLLSGAMTSNATGGNPTAPGTGLVYTNYLTGEGFRFGGANTSANPNGNGLIPGEVSSIYVYNVALSQTEITQMYEATRGRYGV